MQSRAKQSKAKQGKAKQSNTTQSHLPRAHGGWHETSQVSYDVWTWAASWAYTKNCTFHNEVENQYIYTYIYISKIKQKQKPCVNHAIPGGIIIGSKTYSVLITLLPALIGAGCENIYRFNHTVAGAHWSCLAGRQAGRQA
jgi:hypothetical protein